MNNTPSGVDDELSLAVVGMAGQFPGAPNLGAFWDNLSGGVESVTFFTDEQLREQGVAPAWLADPRYVKASPVLDNPGMFDAGLFGYSPREARFMDPQHRLLLECGWACLEDAGCDPERFAGAIGVFAGSAMNTYLLFSGLLPHYVSEYLPTLLANDKDFLATRLSYKLNLRGPSITLQTACSTSLVAVHMACQSLLNDECDLALAGGVAVKVPHRAGYLSEAGSIFAPDGHCRPFDAAAQGTLFGSGVGLVALKRLEDARADGDSIHAIIRGSAINNDGAGKSDYTAPSVHRYAAVVAEALSSAGVGADSVSYVEAHGTGTYLGDPIEVAALTQAFRLSSQSRQFCGLGSVKSNIGHLDAAAGIAGLLKTVLALRHRQLPPTVNFSRPNPEIPFDESPFCVVDALRPWTDELGCRRAGVSSLGIGGTNAHVILEEAPPVPRAAAASKAEPAQTQQLIVLSAQSPAALDRQARNLGTAFESATSAGLADAAYTLQTGRRRLAHRRFVVCRGPDEAARALQAADSADRFTGQAEAGTRRVVFLFPGQGSQYPGMGRGLYASEPVYREHLDRALAILSETHGVDLWRLVLPAERDEAAVAGELQQTRFAQPALFAVEYALARQWMAWGVEPTALAGHSIGEYVAACLAGVFSFEDALRIVAERGRLMQEQPAGAMLAVPLRESDLAPYLSEHVELSVRNGPSQSVLSGPHAEIDRVEQRLQADGVSARRLHTSHAFHSQMMEPAAQGLERLLRDVPMRPPEIPLLSNTTGTWISDAEATSPQYWAAHLRKTVRFADNLAVLLDDPDNVLLEVGPGQTLCALTRQHPACSPERVVVPSARRPDETTDDSRALLNALGRLWIAGVEVDWDAVHGGAQRQRVPLPTYPFERKHFWFQAQGATSGASWSAPRGGKQSIERWFYIPSWKRSPRLNSPAPREGRTQLGEGLGNAQRSPPDARGRARGRCLLLADDSEPAKDLAEVLRNQGFEVRNEHFLSPDNDNRFERMIEEMKLSGTLPDVIVHAATLSPAKSTDAFEPAFQAQAQRGFSRLISLAAAMGRCAPSHPCRLVVASRGMHDVTGAEPLDPGAALLPAALTVVAQEYPELRCRSVDFDHETGVESVAAECVLDAAERHVAYRGGHRWVPCFEPIDLPASDVPVVRRDGVYLITGGLGSIGLILARGLARQAPVRLALLGRSALPPRDSWSDYLGTHREDDALARRMRGVLELEALGATVSLIQADVADREALRGALDQLTADWGPIHGVIHAAGVVGEEALRPVSETDPQLANAHFRSKVLGLAALDAALPEDGPDFVVTVSSISSVLGGLGHAAYAAANAAMDSYALRRNRRGGTPWLSIDWDFWHTYSTRSAGGSLTGLGIDPDEGVDAFLRCLAQVDLGRIVVSTGDLPDRIRQWVNLEATVPGGSEDLPTGDAERSGVASSATSSDATSSDAASSDAASSERAATQRASSEDAPATSTEQHVAAIWAELLGMDRVGRHDDFSELGGHSLLATQVVSRLRGACGVDLSVRQLFECPTVASLSAWIDDQGTSAEKPDDALARLLLQVQSMDETEPADPDGDRAS